MLKLWLEVCPFLSISQQSEDSPPVSSTLAAGKYILEILNTLLTAYESSTNADHRSSSNNSIKLIPEDDKRFFEAVSDMVKYFCLKLPLAPPVTFTAKVRPFFRLALPSLERFT